jgi:proline-specific peptidase
MTEDNPREGTIPFKIPSTGDAAHTFYKAYGDLSNGQRPVIILHGGPGAGHEYCLPFAKLHSLYNIPTIFYDQIGCAQSSHFPQKLRDETFWHPDLFVAELNNLIKHFGLDRADGTGYDIIGHSWGGMVASYFASHQPTRLRRLILASATSDRDHFSAGLWKKLEQMSPQAKSTVEKAIERDDLTSPEYLAVADEFMRTYLCRARPYPPPLLAMNMKHKIEDPTVGLTL